MSSEIQVEESRSLVGSHRSAILAGKQSVSRVVELAFERIAASDGASIMRHVREREARAEAALCDDLVRREGATAWIDRPLLGVPITVKELIPVAGVPYQRGADGPRVASAVDGPAVRRLRAAGCVVLGTTCSPADGWCGASLNGLRPPTRNPWDPELTTGGSSAGAAAAVAGGVGVAAIGTDGAGSVRIPATFCGVVGYKPTFGAIPYVPLSSEGLSHVGVLALAVADAAALVEVMRGPDPADPTTLGTPEHAPLRTPAADAPVRVAWAPSLGEVPPVPEVLAAARDAVEELAAAGHAVEEVDAPAPDPYPALATILAAAEARAEDDGDLHPLRRSIRDWGRGLSAADLAAAIEAKLEVTVAYERLLEDFDVVVTPTVPVLPFLATEAAPASFAADPRDWLRWTPNTYVFNLTGQPAVSVPVGRSSEGLPIGVQVAAARHRDGVALRIAALLEDVRLP